MGLFSRKYSILDKRLLEGATDHHSHILFGVDDGVSKPEDSLTILAMLEEAASVPSGSRRTRWRMSRTPRPG